MRHRVLAGILLFLYFCTLTWLSAGVPFVFTSPDENANFIFAATVMSTNDFGILDTVNIPLDGLVHPRSVVVVQGMAQPGSFLGWPLLAGMFGKLSGAYGIVLLTPFLVIIALVLWWDLCRTLMKNGRMATVATALLALHPAFWYYSARSMMHNVPFLLALIVAAWLAYTRPISRGAKTAWAQRVELFVAGLGIGTALCIRTAEAVWVLAVTVVLVFVWAKSEKRKAKVPAKIVALAVGITIPLVVMGWWNAHLYGGPLVNGYTVEDTSGAVTTDVQVALAEAETTTFLDELGAMLLPFGVHPRAMLRNVWHYGVWLFPWMTVLATAGIVLAFRHHSPSTIHRRDHWRLLVWMTLGLAVWLGMVYGSWTFSDNPDPTAITIGDSHVRYWLPLFALSTLFAARALVTFVAPFTRAQPAAVAVVVGTLSAMIVFGGPDGLLRTRQVLFESAAKRAAIIDATEDAAIIVVDRADKFLFPYRRVIQPLRSEVTYAALPDAVNLAPLYYYGIPFPESDMTYLNTVKLAGLGLRIDPVQMIGDEMLYRITEAVD